MKYQVPQFIDVEDKIFGPLTFKQFVYLAGGAGLSFALYSILPLFVAIIIIAPVAILALALAFYKVNEKPFIFMLGSALKYFTSSKLYIWKKRDNIKKEAPGSGRNTAGAPTQTGEQYIPKLSDSKLKELAWSLGIKDSIYSNSKDSSKMKS
ncbi:MAG: Uncharacterized protein Athens071416_240 [Parcubacteria group bacterium Athens0714_16]|nr:MAG: Uncharacterized protein Athens071416_240 [Parcubacteria group bacterium Athens0714_16]